MGALVGFADSNKIHTKNITVYPHHHPHARIVHLSIVVGKYSRASQKPTPETPQTAIMFIELALVSILNSVNLAFLIEQTRAAKLYNRGGVELRETTTPRGSIVFCRRARSLPPIPE